MSIRSNLRSSRLDQRATFQRDYGTQDASGDVPQEWRDLITCWVSVDGEKGREAALGNGIVGESTFIVWVRSDVYRRFAFTPKDRIVWDGKYLNIQSIADQQLRGRMQPLVCTSDVNAG